MKIEHFLQEPGILLDVRSPSEFIQGHIPGALSFPLFSDEERAQVGTLYKKEGKEAAVKLGLHFVGPKLVQFIEHAERLSGPPKSFRIYCWRGGMRSSSVAWLLQTAGFECALLSGGYKTYRHWALDSFNKSYPFVVLGGLTGSGKTEMLHLLKQEDEQVLDLEKIANHRGSSFGHLGFDIQPSTEHFENLLAWQLFKCDLDRPIWIEDESRMIGKCPIPHGIWEQMHQSRFIWIQSSMEDRIKRLLENYGNQSASDIILAAEKMVKKLGVDRTRQIVQMIRDGKMEQAISMMLDYYDRAYHYAFKRSGREGVVVDFGELDKILAPITKK